MIREIEYLREKIKHMDKIIDELKHNSEDHLRYIETLFDMYEDLDERITNFEKMVIPY